MESCLCWCGGPPSWLTPPPWLLAGWLTPPLAGYPPPPRDGWLGRSAFTLTKRTCLLSLCCFVLNRDSFWPNGVPAEPQPSRDNETKMRTRVVAKAKMLGSVSGSSFGCVLNKTDVWLNFDAGWFCFLWNVILLLFLTWGECHSCRGLTDVSGEWNTASWRLPSVQHVPTPKTQQKTRLRHSRGNVRNSLLGKQIPGSIQKIALAVTKSEERWSKIWKSASFEDESQMKITTS